MAKTTSSSPPPHKPAKKRRRWSRRRIICVSILIIAIVIFFWMSFKTDLRLKLSGKYEELTAPALKPPQLERSELKICEDLIAENWYSPHYSMMVKFSVYAQVEDKQKRAEVYQRIKSQQDTLEDRIRAVAAGVSLEQLKDPHLRIVKKRIQQDLDEMLGPDLVDGVLIPEWHIKRNK